MKSLLRLILVTALTIGVIGALIPGLTYQGNAAILGFAAMVLTLANVVLKPVLKIVLLPITVVTLGFFGWLVNVVILYITTLVVNGFDVTSFSLTAGSRTLIFSKFLAFVIISFLLNIVSRAIDWIFD